MAWRIHSWDESAQAGEVVSPHFGPWPFGAQHNLGGTADFVPGEEVVVELDGPVNAYVVRSVARVRRRAETLWGTACEVLEPVNRAEHRDLWVMEEAEGLLRLWVGDCCSTCNDSWVVTFRGVHLTRGLEDDLPDDPVFRVATESDVAEHQLDVPAGCRAYRILGMDYPTNPALDDVFIVAAHVEAEHRLAGRC